MGKRETKEIAKKAVSKKDLEIINEQAKAVLEELAANNKATGKTEIKIKEVKIKEDEIELPVGIIKLKATKLKYFKNGQYNNFMLIKSMGISDLLRYDEGEDAIKDFMSAALDIDKKEITYFDDMTTTQVLDLVEKINKINNIQESDFLTQASGVGVKE